MTNERRSMLCVVGYAAAVFVWIFLGGLAVWRMLAHDDLLPVLIWTIGAAPGVLETKSRAALAAWKSEIDAMPPSAQGKP